MEKTTLEIKKVKSGEVLIEQDVIICEYPYTIYINNEELMTLLCTPKDLKEMTYGFLYSEGFIKCKDDIIEFYLDEKNGICRVYFTKDIDLAKKLQGKRARTTGCGKGTIFYHTMDSLKSKKIDSHFQISSNKIIELSKELNKKSDLFLETGGVHSSMLVIGNDILFFEDVGRHNTIDKIIGHALLNDFNLTHSALFTSGRISSEMLLKTLKAQIPMIVSRSAPTDLAVKIAREYDVTLIGFVRGDKMNIYHDSNRIII